MQITEDFSRRVVKTFSGVGPDLFAPIYWDGSSDQGDFVDPERDYTLELTVSDALGHKAFTHRQGLQLSVPSPALVQKAPANKQTKRVQNLAYKNWLQRLAKQDTTARSHIRVIGKIYPCIRRVFWRSVRISLDNQLLVEMPSYQQPESDVADILRGQSLDKDLSQKTHIDLIVPRGKLHIQVLGDKAIVSEQSASQPLIQPPIQPVAQTTVQQSVIRKRPTLLALDNGLSSNWVIWLAALSNLYSRKPMLMMYLIFQVSTKITCLNKRTINTPYSFYQALIGKSLCKQ